jgi:hypothetical protein
MLPKSIICAAFFLLLNLSTHVYAAPIPEAEAAYESYIKYKGAKDTIGDVEKLKRDGNLIERGVELSVLVA